MRPLLNLKYFLVGLLIFIGASISIPVTHAQVPAPIPPTKSNSAPSAPRTTNYTVFLPFIVSNGASAPAIRKGIPLTYSDCSTAIAMGVTWEHSWSPTPPNCAGMDNVPMIWSAAEMNTTLGGNSQWVMGFNEPDLSWQSNLSPAQAAQLWRQVEQKYPTRKLLSPGPSGANPNWLLDFRNAYIAAYNTPPRLDGLQTHCYAWYTSQCTDLMQIYLGYANSWGVPEIWVTEFSFATTSPSSPTRAPQEMQNFITWMQGNPKFTRYAWYASKIQGNEWWSMPAFHTPLVDWNTGQPTSFGSAYLPLH